MSQKTAQHGSWKSPVTSDLIVSATINFSSIKCDGSDIYFVEWRPTEGGRYCLVRHSDVTCDITPPAFNVRSRVHEYGGGAYAVADGNVIFSNYTDQHLYLQNNGGAPRLIFAESGMRCCDGVIDRRRNRFVCICEDHSRPEQEAVNSIVSLPLDGQGAKLQLASGNSFYSNPRITADGRKIAWLTWNHPNMPWDGCELWSGTLAEDGTLAESRLIAGGSDESIFQPEWSPDGTLYFISDRTGWWNLYRCQNSAVEALCPMEAEFGRPQWSFGYSTYAFLSASQIVATYTSQGSWKLALIDLTTRSIEPIETRFTDISYLQSAGRNIVFRGGSPQEAPCIVTLNISERLCKIVRSSSTTTIDAGYLSAVELINFPTEDGLSARGLFYPPRNKDYCAPDSESPPLLVMSHGGPTGQTSSTLNLEIQYWTSRGIAVLDVDYGGSSGYGRGYRQRLNGLWGVVDVDDCINGAQHLVRRGDVDGNRLMITGASAGGYTTLCALTFRNCFRCGASHYGIGNLEAMVKDTHKFEARYLDRLIGPYPQRQALYRARSPICHVDKLSCPVIFFQGLEDKVVPPNQAESMVAALRAKKIPVAYVAFPGEQHGFRQAETLRRVLDGELYFYSQVLGFTLADSVEPIEIDCL